MLLFIRTFRGLNTRYTTSWLGCLKIDKKCLAARDKSACDQRATILESSLVDVTQPITSSIH
jgi:hypothetical protein